MKALLNVGGLSKAIALPARYEGWRHDLLDIDARFDVDIVMDARHIAEKLAAHAYDAVYCSDALEHFSERDAITVLRGFLHVLKPDGFAELHVPDIFQIMKVVAGGKDLSDTLYEIHGVRITPLDVIYGHQRDIRELGNDHYAHKTGFTARSMESTLREAGFAGGFIVAGDANKADYEMTVFGFKNAPSRERIDAIRRGEA